MNQDRDIVSKHEFVQFQVLQPKSSPDGSASAGGIYALDGNGQLWFSALTTKKRWTALDQDKEIWE